LRRRVEEQGAGWRHYRHYREEREEREEREGGQTQMAETPKTLGTAWV